MTAPKHPLLTPITRSSNVTGSAHDGEHLYVSFKGKPGEPDSVYRYDNQFEAHHHQMQTHESAGKYFHENIRGKGITGTRIV